MKPWNQEINKQQWMLLSSKAQEEVLYFLHERGYRHVTLGVCLELLATVSYNLHTEDSDGRFFNNLMSNIESVIGWDGNQTDLLGTIWYNINEELKQMLSVGRSIKDKMSNPS